MKQSVIIVLMVLVMSTLAGCGHFTVAPQEERNVEVSLLIRKQFTTEPCKKRDRVCRHIDILLPGNRIVGYNVRPGKIGIFRYIFRNSKGIVRELDELKKVRRHYVDAKYAQDMTYKGREHLHMVTLRLRFMITQKQADKLCASWDELRKEPPPFRLFGNNCASRATECFVDAGVLPWGLPGLDRPENVYKQVLRYYPDAVADEGYFGFDEQDNPVMIPLVCPAK